MNITDTTIDHLPRIAELEKKCFSLPWTYEQLENLLLSPNRIFLSALDEDGNVFAYVNLTFVLDEGYIGNLAVDEAHRRQGAAAALLHRLERRCVSQKLSFITLEVREGNTAAIRLYEKCSYECVGLRKNYYVNPQENAVLMTKLLPVTLP